jgi:hypothetical protein
MADDDSTIVQLMLSAVVIVVAIPGLIIEPGPLSELAALAALGAIWGFDLPGGAS